MPSTIIEYEQLLTAENIEKAITYLNNFNATRLSSVKKIALALIDAVLNNSGKPLSNALLIHEIIETQAIENQYLFS